jgi:PAS domain S-box-containing protein
MKGYNYYDDIEKLKSEIELYKRLISHIPFSFTYHDSHLGVEVHKSEGGSFSIKETEETVEKSSLFQLVSDHNIYFDHFDKIERFLTKILDLVPHHIVFIDKNGIITLCNMQTAKDYNINRDEIIGKHIRELLRIPDEKIVTLETAKTGKEVYDKEVLDRNYGIMNTRIIYDRDGSIKRVIGTFQFLNKIKEAEKQALAGRIAAGIAHEIRNPLTTVRGYLQLLQNRVKPELTDLFKSLLIPELDRANKIITDLLRIAKPSDTKEERFQVKEFFLDYAGKFFNSEAFLYNVKIEYDISPESGECYIEGDRDELLQVFMNLFNNSLNAKGDKPLVIQIRTERLNNEVKITFRDNGTGIPESILNHIFDPFFTTKEEGTGLGLSVSRKIIENHKGSIDVSSSEKGTVFTVLLPIIHTNETADRD